VEGTERAKVAFAVGRLATEDLQVPALDPLRQLSGKIPGVRIAQTSGRPGAAPEILMRGPTSLNAQGRGQGPLIIVDGAIMNVGNLDELGALDIESVEVVKGAAGASLYGTRAAKGVITIKTKRGATGTDGIRFNARTEYGISDLNSLEYGLPTQHGVQLDETGTRFCVTGTGALNSCSQTFDWMTEIMRINAVKADTVRTTVAAQFANPSATGGQLQNVYQANIWPNRYYNTLAQWASRNPISINHLDATGRIGGVRFYVSGSYQDEGGAVKQLDGTQQRRGRMNLDYDVRSDLLVSVSSLYDNGTTDNRNPGGGFGTLLRGAPPGTDYTAKDSLGRFILRGKSGRLRGTDNGSATFLYNTQADNEVNSTFSSRFLGNLGVNYFPAEWLSVESQVAFDTRATRDEYWLIKGYRTTTASASANNGQMQMDSGDSESWNGSLTATLRRQLRPDLNGKISFRALYDQSKSVSSSAYGEQFLVKDIFDLDNLGNTGSFDVGSSRSETRNQGFFAGGSLDFRDKYIVDMTFRRDGSSRFGANHRWASFGRFSGVWRISEEDFWTVPFMDDFRVRASRGTAGSTPQFSAQYETFTVTTSTTSLGQAGNSQLRPETTTETELGTDFTLWNRLGVEFTYAVANTEDQIIEVQTEASLGFTTQWRNVGTLQNKTFELGLNLPIINKRDLSWSMRGTWDRTRTYITELFVPKFTYTPTGQGSGSFFQITADKYSCRYSAVLPAGAVDDCTNKAGVDNTLGTADDIIAYSTTNGYDANRYGNIWGRRFLKSCSDLDLSKAQFAGMTCGNGGATDVSDFQINDQGYLVWVGAGNNWRDGITKNLWQTILPGASSPWGATVPLYWGMAIVDRPLSGEPGAGNGILQVIGNVLPDFRFGWSNNVTYKRMNLYALLEGTIGHNIYNQGEQWGLFDWNSAGFDMRSKSVQTAKPMGYGWRTGPSEGAGIGGFYDILLQNNYNTEDGSYAKVREVSLSYNVGPVRGVGDWTVAVVGRNLMTFTNYSGYDPETGVGGGNTGSGLINQVDAFGFPTLRTFTFTVSSRF